MIEAKKREMEKELDDLEEEDSYTDDDDMDGSPTFLEPLQDTLFKEGEKFQLSCSIAGFPQPKVNQKTDVKREIRLLYLTQNLGYLVSQ